MLPLLHGRGCCRPTRVHWTPTQTPRAVERSRMACWVCSFTNGTEKAPSPQPFAPLWSLLPPSMRAYLQAKAAPFQGWWGGGAGALRDAAFVGAVAAAATLLFLLPKTGRKPILLDVHLALSTSLSGSPTLRAETATCVLLHHTSSCLPKVSNSCWALSRYSGCGGGCRCNHWVVSGCKGGAFGPRDVSARGTFLCWPAPLGRQLLRSPRNEQFLGSSSPSPSSSLPLAPASARLRAWLCMHSHVVQALIIIAWSRMPNGIQGQHIRLAENPPWTVNGYIHFPLAAPRAIAKASHQNLILPLPPHAKPSFMITGQGKLMGWGASPSH